MQRVPKDAAQRRRMSQASLYSADYFIGHAYGEDPKRQAMKRQEAGRIKRRLSRPHEGRALDIGCGIGDFLAEHFGGWDKVGVEVSLYARARAADRGFQCYADIEEVSGEFDLVVWRGTFQHLDRPMEVLWQCVQMLRPGGLLVFLATPNSNGLVYKLFEDLPALDAPRNFVIPSEKMLVNILSNMGLRDIEVVKPYLGSPYAQPIKDAVKFCLRLLGAKTKFAWPGSMMEIYARK